MQTKSVYVMNLCVPCENRCRYCLLSYNGKTNGVDYKRSEAYAKRFYVIGNSYHIKMPISSANEIGIVRKDK